MKGRPEVCLIVTFGLGHRLESARIVETAEPYRNRFTHHVPVSVPADIDVELMDWLRAAYTFSASKR